jgi:predicted RecB family nuclease
LKYERFIAAEQEFNTTLYGIKGNIDSTIVVKDPQGVSRETALEIKTGKYKTTGYRGQVLLYSLIISERFLTANPDNILLYIMDESLRDIRSDSFQYVKQTRSELDNIMRARNELAKWQKRNNNNETLNISKPEQIG